MPNNPLSPRALVAFAALVLLSCAAPALAQHEDERYVRETDPQVLARLEQWQDLKFGLLMHWGPYSQWGVVESWSICAEDEGWCRRSLSDYIEYKRRYEALKTTFNPVKFDPAPWAKAAREAGMKYVVFTTKHHDGFSMFDTKLTDYKVTSVESPFSANPRANIAKEIFDTFRENGFWVGAYFSKPDWHNENYWWPNFATPDRNVNYDPALYPERWKAFTDFTHGQVMELMSDYGRIDILWLDGGWVRKRPKEETERTYAELIRESKTGFLKARIVDQDIRMDDLVAKARQKQPGLIVVDRAVYGKNQNYLTPENRVPEKALPYPWESCIISGGGWSFTPDAKYMSGRDGVHMLVDIVAKGGNLLLNVAPGPDGTWQQGGVRSARADRRVDEGERRGDLRIARHRAVRGRPRADDPPEERNDLLRLPAREGRDRDAGGDSRHVPPAGARRGRHAARQPGDARLAARRHRLRGDDPGVGPLRSAVPARVDDQGDRDQALTAAARDTV